MLVCIPTKNNEGMDAPVHDHFGSALYFTLVETDTKELQIIENSNAHHTHGTCHPMNQLTKHKIDAVLCSGMGRRAVEALNAEGIKTMIADAPLVKDAISMLEDGKIQDIDPSKACRGLGQHHHDTEIQIEPGRGAGFGRKDGSGGGRGMGAGRRSGSGGSGRGRRG